MEFLLSRPVVIALALLGALLSSAASIGQVRKAFSLQAARALNLAGYACMAASMLLFIVAGFVR